MLSKLKKSIYSHGAISRILRGMLTLALGSGAAKLISLLSIPILTRIYSPDEYGVLSVFASLILLLVPLASFRYVVAIPLPSSDRLAFNVVALSFFVITISTVLITFAFSFFGEAILTTLSMELLLPYWWLIPVSVFGAACYEALSLWATRRKSFAIIAKTQVNRAAIGASLQVFLGLLGFRPIGLLIGHVVSQSGGLVAYLVRFRQDIFLLKSSISLARMRFLSCFYKNVPIYRLPSQILLVFSQQIPLLFLAANFGAATAGQFGLALFAVKLPVSLLSASMSKAYYAEIASNKHPFNIKKVTFSLLKRLPVFVVPPVIFLALFGPMVFALVFGEQWEQAGKFARMMSIYLAASMLAVIFAPLLNVLNRQKSYLVINLVRIVVMLLALFIPFLLEADAIQTVLVYCIAMLLFQSGNVLWYVSIIKSNAKGVGSA